MSQYEKDFSKISDRIVTAYQNWEIWWLYKSERPKYLKTMNKYSIFFSNSIHAHWVALVMAVWCLIDEKHLSLFSLYKKLCKNNSIREDIKKEIDKRIHGLANIIKGMTIIRHNVVAHTSNKVDSDFVFTKANLKYDDIRDIIIELGNIYNLMCISMGRNILGFCYIMDPNKPDEFVENDVKDLLDDLVKFNSKPK